MIFGSVELLCNVSFEAISWEFCGNVSVIAWKDAPIAIMAWTKPPTAPTGLEEEAHIIYEWARDRGASQKQSVRIV